MKSFGKLVGVITLVMAILFSMGACDNGTNNGGDPDHGSGINNGDDPDNGNGAISDLSFIRTYLDAQSGGATVNNPVNLVLQLELNSTNWDGILNSIAFANKFVNLDLSACTRSNNPSDVYGLSRNGVFNAERTSNAINNRVVSMVLPEAAVSIAAGTNHYSRCPVTGISTGFSTFRSFINLKHISTGNGVTNIGAFGLSGYPNLNFQLTSVTIGNSVTTIGDGAFVLNKLTSVTIPDSVTTIGRLAFAENELTNVVIGNSVTEIGYSAFSSGQSSSSLPPGYLDLIGNQLTSVTIPDSVITIGERAFSNNQLTSVVIGNSVTTIGDTAFSNNQLTSMVIPDSVTTIGQSAFSYNQLTSVTIGNSVTEIGDIAFRNNLLTSVDIPDSVTSIDFSSVFFGCGDLSSINISSGNPVYSSIDGVVYNKDRSIFLWYPQGKLAETFTIPDSVISIGRNAFYNITSLTSVTIPGSVTTIGRNAFNGCTSLTSVTIPSSVISIEIGAFTSCSSLFSVTFEGLVTWDLFDNILSGVFPGNLREVALRGGIGTYITDNPGVYATWRKQS